MRCKILRMISHEAFRWVYIKGHYEVLAMKNKYKPIYRIKKGLSNGNRRADKLHIDHLDTALIEVLSSKYLVEISSGIYDIIIKLYKL